jgi:hypothetical protein
VRPSTARTPRATSVKLRRRLPTVTRWKIIGGPDKRSELVDGQVWGFVIENTSDPAQRRFLGVTITRTVLQSDRSVLFPEVGKAIETQGLSVIETYLDVQEPPEMIIVSTTGIRPEGAK